VIAALARERVEKRRRDVAADEPAEMGVIVDARMITPKMNKMIA
jgi:hypothetical protein